MVLLHWSKHVRNCGECGWKVSLFGVHMASRVHIVSWSVWFENK